MKYALLAGACIIITCTPSCFCHHSGMSFKVTESANYYTMEAFFNKNKTLKVQQFMNSELGDRNSISFINTRTDAMITLDDKTTFYMISNPGELKIKLNKHDNSYESYTEIKDMCEGLKGVMGGK